MVAFGGGLVALGGQLLKLLLGLIEAALRLRLLLLTIGQVGGVLAEPGGKGRTLRLGEMQIALRLIKRAGQLGDAVGLGGFRDGELPLRLLTQRVDPGLPPPDSRLTDEPAQEAQVGC